MKGKKFPTHDNFNIFQVCGSFRQFKAVKTSLGQFKAGLGHCRAENRFRAAVNPTLCILNYIVKNGILSAWTP